MGVALLQLFLCLVAGFALWRLWRAFDGEDRFVRGVVFVGFLGRAAAGIALFWISYLRLPFGQSLQIGDGLWFFALDARLYLPNAAAAAHEGLGAIIGYNRGAASVTYVQTLATFALLFGIVASVALLLNLFCYLGSCLILVRLRRLTPAAKVPAAIAIAAISLSPSAMLWSLQPLKDTLFQFLIITFVAACVMWQRAWRSEPAPLLAAGAAAIMGTALFAMGGIRWYFAFSVLCATFAFLFLIGATAARRRALALVAGTIVFAILTQAFIFGAGPYTPPRLLDLFSLSRPGASRLAALSPSHFLRDLRDVRSGFERAGGATSIGVGGTLARFEQHPPQTAGTSQPVAVPPPQAPPPVQPKPEAKPETVEKRETASASLPETSETSEAEDPSPPAAATTHREAAVTTTVSHSPAPAVTNTTATHAAAPPPQNPRAAPQHAPAATNTVAQHASVPPPPPTKTAAPAVAASAPPTTTAAPAHPHPPAPATTTAVQSVSAATPAAEQASSPPQKSTPLKSARAKKTSKPVPPIAKEPAVTASAPVNVPAPVVTTAPPAPAFAPAPVPAVEKKIVLPESTTTRLMTGAIALLVPRTIASSQGLLDIRGGKGLFWFTDLDTIAFDIVVLFALGFFVARIRWATLRNPAFWFVGVLIVLVGVPLIYTITNFGTLFRLRMMVYTAAAMIPLALAMAAAPRESVPMERPAVEPAPEPADAVAMAEPQGQ